MGELPLDQPRQPCHRSVFSPCPSRDFIPMDRAAQGQRELPRMPYRVSTRGDLSAPSIPSRGTVRAFGARRCGLAYLLPRLSALGCLTSLACLGPVGSEEAHPKVLASVRRSNGTCGFPACRFHEGT